MNEAVRERMPSAPQLDSRPVPPQRTAPRSAIFKIFFAAALISSAAAFIAPIASSQDLGEIARQERAKKQNNPAPPATHVYTNEDVKRAEILTPEDRTRFSATTQPATVKPSQSAPQLASESAPGNADLMIGARLPIHNVSTVPEPAKNELSVIADSQSSQAEFPASVPLDQMPLGDIARFYRVKTHVYAKANSQTDPGPVNAPSASTLATTISIATSLDQMPLGDVARYYRGKKREEDSAIANRAPTTSAMSVSPPSTETTGSSSPTTSKSKYPLALTAMPLAAMKPAPRGAPRPHRSSIAHPTKPHGLVAPKRSVGGNAISIRISSGDTLWQLARKYLGSATRWHDLAALNPNIQDPRHLQIGTQLVLRTPAI